MAQTRYGEVQGIDRGDYWEYRGIPYAKPPVGALRWKAPQKPERFQGVYQAVEFHGKCWQAPGSMPPWDRDFYDDPAYDRKMDEDCLYLHIWAPKDAGDCPVAFWIHGGAFLNGWATEKEFDGAAFARRGIIFVSVDYRCNLFGYLAHPWLTAESGTSGNYGSLDQAAALEWVAENIDGFGGDPGKITVFGQSAGAMSTQTLVCSPLAGKWISRAILQSGGVYGSAMGRAFALREAEEFGKAFTDLAGVRNLEEMRAMPAEDVYAMLEPLSREVEKRAGGLFLRPCIDGYFLTDNCTELMDRGEIRDIPYMIGCTKDDLMSGMSDGDRTQAPLYRGSVAFSHKLEDLGRKPAYVYCFARDLPGDAQGAWHSAELWYMMGTLDRCWRPWTEQDRMLSRDMLDAWSAFMRTGDPNGNGQPLWKPCTREEPFVREFNVPDP